MEHSVSTVEDKQSDQLDKFNPVEAAEMLGMTPQQRLFADGLRRGLNQTRAYAAAYDADPASKSTRAAACKAAKSDRIRAYLAWSKGGGDGAPDDPADARELRKILTRHARGADKATSIRAIEVLHRLELADREAEANRPFDPKRILDRMSELVGVVLPGLLAAQYQLEWSPPETAKPGLAPPFIVKLVRDAVIAHAEGRLDEVLPVPTAEQQRNGAHSNHAEAQRTFASLPTLKPNPDAVEPPPAKGAVARSPVYSFPETDATAIPNRRSA